MHSIHLSHRLPGGIVIESTVVSVITTDSDATLTLLVPRQVIQTVVQETTIRLGDSVPLHCEPGFSESNPPKSTQSLQPFEKETPDEQ
ncbi:MAG: hypothetical protein HUU10_14600 [Bacteroidetes bacterium]|nr:hypothetical protein [Bacteroidota bacterium]